MRKTSLLTIIAILVALVAGCAGGEEADKAPPLISGISASNITQTGALITWTTDEDSTSQVEYGPTTSYGSTTALDEDLVTSHSVSLSGLTAGTTYHYRVKSKDASGNERTSPHQTFTTLGLADTTAPVISNVTVSDITETTVTITWTTDEPATSQVEYGPTTSYGSTTTLDEDLVTSHSVSLSELQPDTTYHFRVKSKDQAGNDAISDDSSFNTAPSLGQVQGTLVAVETGQPLAGAAVILCRVTEETEGILQASLSCSTESDGDFELSNVPPGKYVVLYDPSGEGKDGWTQIDQLEIDYSFQAGTCEISNEFYQSFFGGVSVTYHQGFTCTSEDGVIVFNGALTSQAYNLTMEFHDSSKPVMLEVEAGETTEEVIEVTATYTPPEPTIAFEPTSFSFTATEGGANPPSQTLDIWNSGSGTLSWSVKTNVDWLDLEPTSGTSTAVTVSVDITGLAADTYNATITISAPGATNTPQTVPMSLTVNPAGPAELPGTFQYSIDYSDSDGNTMSIDVWVKDGKARSDWEQTPPGEPTQRMIFISDGEFDWLYNPDENTALKYPPESGMNPGIFYEAWFGACYYGPVSESGMLEAAQMACEDEPTCASVDIIGHETIGGEYCAIFTWTGTDGSTATVWISASNGYPLRLEFIDATGFTVTMEFTGIDLNPTISDDIFDVDQVFAPGTEIIDMTW